MRTRFAVLFALFLACAPVASAQLVAPPSVGHYDLNGAWNVQGVIFGTLTLTTNANGTLRGTFVSAMLSNTSASGGSMTALDSSCCARAPTTRRFCSLARPRQ